VTQQKSGQTEKKETFLEDFYGTKKKNILPYKKSTTKNIGLQFCFWPLNNKKNLNDIII